MRHHLRHPTRHFTCARILLGCLLAVGSALHITHHAPPAHAATAAPIVAAH